MMAMQVSEPHSQDESPTARTTTHHEELRRAPTHTTPIRLLSCLQLQGTFSGDSNARNELVLCFVVFCFDPMKWRCHLQEVRLAQTDSLRQDPNKFQTLEERKEPGEKHEQLSE